jgi:glycosyltransferase involved in cell wall biosynthesis
MTRAVADPSGVSGDEAVRLLQFLTLFAVGGTERQVMNLARGLDPSRFEVHFACLKRVGEYVEEIERSGRPLTEYPIDRMYGPKTWRRQAQLARDLRRAGIRLVHTYGFWTNVFGIPAARLAGTPAVVGAVRDTCDDLTPAQRRVQRLACRLADAVVVNAEAIKRRLVDDGWDPAHITVIRNGVDLAPFDRPREPGRVRRELGLPPDAPLVAVFARLTPVKGIEYFLEAAKAVADRFPEARFLVVGEARLIRDGVAIEGPCKRDLQARAARLGLADRVVFTGFRPDVPDVLAEVAVSVLPCVLNEGLSNSVLESMAAGVPVVATTVGGNPEVVEDGVTGFLVPPRDGAALARGIGVLLSDRARAAGLGRAARSAVERKFSTGELVRRTERFYQELLERKAPATRPAAGRVATETQS